MTKKLIYIFLATLMVMGLSACDNKTENSTESSTSLSKESSTTPAKESSTIPLKEPSAETQTQLKSAADAITIINPRIRAMPPGQKVTAMYMQLENSSAANHDLVKVEGDISQMIELHTHTNNNGVMQMGEVESIPVPANSTAEAKPGSYHVMIMGLQKNLNIGEKFEFNLFFKDGSSKSISAEVKTLELN